MPCNAERSDGYDPIFPLHEAPGRLAGDYVSQRAGRRKFPRITSIDIQVSQFFPNFDFILFPGVAAADPTGHWRVTKTAILCNVLPQPGSSGSLSNRRRHLQLHRY